MSNENLQTCIEKCTLRGVPFFYDSRFGAKIKSDELHPAYKQCFNADVKPVDRIITITRDVDSFHITLESNNTQLTTTIRFYYTDKTFVCRDYDPTVIIPAIIHNEQFTDYFIINGHPSHKFGYVANYMWSPEKTYYNKEFNMDIRYAQAIDDVLKSNSESDGKPSDLIDIDSIYIDSRVQEPESDCDSCGLQEPSEHSFDRSEIDEIVKLFESTTTEEAKVDDEPDPFAIPLKKINRLRNKFAEDASQLLAEIQETNDLPEISLDLIPKYAVRDDNVDSVN